MASDIKITNNRLLLEGGDLPLVTDTNRIIQHLSVGLRLLLGDWVLDQTQGIDYFGGMRAYPEILSAQIKNAINTVEGVQTVLKYNFYINEDDIYEVSATVKVGNTEIAVNDVIYTKSLGA